MSYFDRSLDRYIQTLDLAKSVLERYEQPKIYDIGGYGHFRSMIEKDFGFCDVHDICSADLNTVPLDLPDASADVLFLCEVIEHLYNPDLVIQECRRLLRKGGALILTTPNLTSWFNRLLVLGGYFPMNMDISCELRYSGKKDIFNKRPADRSIKFNPLFDVHVRLYTIPTLKMLLEENGFKVVESRGYWLSKSANFRISSLLDTVNRMFAKIPTLAQGIIMVAEVA
jgi:SAM-dependent methyltransferase